MALPTRPMSAAGDAAFASHKESRVSPNSKMRSQGRNAAFALDAAPRLPTNDLVRLIWSTCRELCSRRAPAGKLDITSRSRRRRNGLTWESRCHPLRAFPAWSGIDRGASRAQRSYRGTNSSSGGTSSTIPRKTYAPSGVSHKEPMVAATGMLRRCVYLTVLLDAASP